MSGRECAGEEHVRRGMSREEESRGGLCKGLEVFGEEEVQGERRSIARAPGKGRRGERLGGEGPT